MAVFYVTATDVKQTLEFLRSSGRIKNDSQPRIKDVLTELQYNAGNLPYEDQLTDELEDLLIHWEDDPEDGEFGKELEGCRDALLTVSYRWWCCWCSWLTTKQRLLLH